MRIERTEYLKELQAWRGKQIIKVITGVRRCGKSVLMEMYAEWLREQGVPKKRIVEVNLEKLDSDTARKIFDFLGGATYALNGNVQKVANNIFIFAPENVAIFADGENKPYSFSGSDENPWK